MSKEESVKKGGKVVLSTCSYRGYMKLDGYKLANYCILCSKGKTDDTHKNLDCKNCPDFEAYSYEYEYT